MHVTSLPGKYGMGDLGPEAYRWVDQLARAKQAWWQILPLGPVGAGDSPYQAYSAFAGNPAVISPDVLRREGLVTAADLRHAPRGGRADRVDFPAVAAFKAELLDRAFVRLDSPAGRKVREGFEKFRRREAEWLEDYALFMALRERFGVGRSWTDWPRDLVRREGRAMTEAKRALAERAARHAFGQFLFFRQLAALKGYANERGVGLIGDLPIFVSPESADVWGRPELFQLDARRRPTAVAGVPPDMFSATGQRWGNPLYDWQAMARDKFEWWVRRLRATLTQVDLVRIDHFRGFAGYWRIPARAPTAQRGRWVKAPGRELFETLRKRLGALPVIAEDLGVITPDVEKLREDFGLPGMRVLQFGFGGGDSMYLPHRHVENSVVYTGTHDNDTTVGWYRSADAATRRNLKRYDPPAAKDPAGELMRIAWASVARIAIAPVQDLLRLGREARMNAPGTAEGNWGWRMREGAVSARRLEELAEMTETYGRG